MEINTIRIIEDSLAFFLLSIAFIYLIRTAICLKETPLKAIPVALLLGLIPMYIWKSMGAFRRAFLEKASKPDLYKSLHDIGEVFESVSGLIIAISFIFILTRLKKIMS